MKKLNKKIQKMLNWFLSMVMIVTSISLPGVAVSAEEKNADTDYSSAIVYNLEYNDDLSKATLTIKVDTEDQVTLDFGNNDELSEKMGGGRAQLFHKS